MIKFICLSLITLIFSITNINTSCLNATATIVKTPPIVVKPNIKQQVLPKKSSLVIDCSNKWKRPIVLYQDSANELRHPASLTKLMTVYLLLEAVQKRQVTFNTKFRVSKFAAQQMPSKLNIKAGETISVLDCIKALLVKSANDVAVVVAEGLSGSVSKFCKRMNKKAKSLGMKNTHYENPSGVPNIKQITCANDIAILGLSLIKKFNEISRYWSLFSLKNFKYKNKTHGTHCKILRWYNGADGAKTGYICASGFNLWVTATRFNKEGKSKRLCAVIFGERSGRERDFKAARLLDKYFGDYIFTNKNKFCKQQNINRFLTNTTNTKIVKLKSNNDQTNSNISIAKNKNKQHKVKYNNILDKQNEIKNQTNSNILPATSNKYKQNNVKNTTNNKSQQIKQNISKNNKKEKNIKDQYTEEILYEIESFPMDDIIKSTGKSKEYFDDLYKDDIPIQVESSTPIDFSIQNHNIKKTNNKKFTKNINKNTVKKINSKNKNNKLQKKKQIKRKVINKGKPNN